MKPKFLAVLIAAVTLTVASAGLPPETNMDQSTTQRMMQLRQALREHNFNYYVLGQPAINDAEFDKLMQELQAIEAAHPDAVTADSPTQVVGGQPIAEFTPVVHHIPMLSIDNCFNWEDLDKWHASNVKALGEEPRYAIDFKVDGLAVTILYEDGLLAYAATRGDGQTGDDVTHNIKTVRGVPLRLLNPVPTLEVRGEVFITHSDFAKVLEAQAAAGEEPFANSRNAASGAMRQLDPKQCSARRLRFFAHGFGDLGGITMEPGVSHTHLMSEIRSHGIPEVPNWRGHLTYAEAKEYAEELIEQLAGLDFPIDGIVFKIDGIAHRATLGAGTKHPHWCRAYKWERYEAPTLLKGITIQVGKQGTLTPVAELEPVIIAETEVSRASLFNRDEIERLGVRLGDTVIVEKAGKIIPHIVRVDLTKRLGGSSPFPFPTKCPVCTTPVVQDGDVHLKCPNPGCPAQLKGAILAFCDRSRMDIEDIGPKLVDLLVDNKLVTWIPDLYTLESKKGQLLAIPGIGDGTVENLIWRTCGSKLQPVWRLIAGLNIKHIGRTLSQRLVEHLKPEDISEHPSKWLTETTLQGINVGAVAIASFTNYVHSARGQATLQVLKTAGCTMGYKAPIVNAQANLPEQVWAGQTICVTGNLGEMTREEAHAAIIARGGKPSDSVNGKTNLLVAGDKAGSKLAKAQAANVAVMYGQEFLNVINNTKVKHATAYAGPYPHIECDEATYRDLEALVRKNDAANPDAV